MNLVHITNDINAKSLNPSVKFPKKIMEIDDIINMVDYGQLFSIQTIGFDDKFAYGHTLSAKKLARVENSFANKNSIDLVDGQDFTSDETFTGVISHVEKTYAGYVLVETISGTPNTSNIWFSESFEFGFTKVLSLDRGRVNTFNFTSYHSGFSHKCILMASEYTANANNHVAGQEARLFISKDGGETWELIKTLTIGTEVGYNKHFHTQCFDPYTGRIYASSGDHNINAELAYSDDMGATWSVVPLSTYTDVLPSHHPQPTVMIPTAHKICCSPDNGLPGGVISLIKDTKFTSIGSETFTWKQELAVHPKISTASGSYAVRYAENGNEIYMVIPGVTGNRQCYIVGSGDGGQTWHNVFAINLTGYSNSNNIGSIRGPDIGGFYYCSFAGTYLLKLKAVEWV